MKKINKKLLDELIRVSRKYWKTGDTDLLPKKIDLSYQLSTQAFGSNNHGLSFCDFVDAIVQNSGLKHSATNQDVYNAFAVLDYEVAEIAEDVEEES